MTLLRTFWVGEHSASPRKKRRSIFLAGPSPRGDVGHHWRPEAIAIIEKLRFNGDVYAPLLEDGGWLGDFDKQMDWELQYLEQADGIAFWVPRDLQTLPGLTTNVEYGLYVKSGKAVLGYPRSATHMRYMHRLADICDVPVAHTLEETLALAIRVARK
jgi:hypothetical protein